MPSFPRIAIVQTLLGVALLFAPPGNAQPDSAGKAAFAAVKRCVMDGSIDYCHQVITSESYDIFDKFYGYKLMPCLPTDFVFESEADSDQQAVITATMPASNTTRYIMRLVFARSTAGLKLDIPASLQRGMGPNWKNKLQLSEQLYLMMKANMGDKLNCDMLTNLIKH